LASSNNTTSRNLADRSFFDAISADKYVISANGKYDNPDYDTLKWIVESAHDAGREITLYVTNATTSTAKSLKDHKPESFGYELKTIGAGEHALRIDIG
jgi:hypothetical protein